MTSSVDAAKKAVHLFKKHSGTADNCSVEDKSSSDDSEMDFDDIDDIEGPVLAGMKVPPPVFFCSIEAPSISKQTEMEKALEKLQREDPSLQV